MAGPKQELSAGRKSMSGISDKPRPRLLSVDTSILKRCKKGERRVQLSKICNNGEAAVEWLRSMRLFVSVVQNGSLSSAGRQLGLSPASVSRHISALEENLGSRLLNRTSR